MTRRWQVTWSRFLTMSSGAAVLSLFVLSVARSERDQTGRLPARGFPVHDALAAHLPTLVDSPSAKGIQRGMEYTYRRPQPAAGVGPAGDLVEVVAEARDLPSALALDGLGLDSPRSRTPHRLLQQLGRRHAHRSRLLPPSGMFRPRDTGGTRAVRSATAARALGFGVRPVAPARCSDSGAERWGI